MEKTYSILAGINLGKILTDSLNMSKTQTGRELLEKYINVTMNHPISCTLINNFITEARNCTYDSGAFKAMSEIAEVIENNKYSWQLASICENIQLRGSSYNFLHRNATKQVMDLLENKDEAEIVSYIKAGALKNVMFVESIRNTVKAIYKNNPVLIETQAYKSFNPISYTETHDGNRYFRMDNRTFSMNENFEVVEYLSSEKLPLSQDFYIINKLISEAEFCGGDMLKFNIKNTASFSVSSQGKIMRNDTEMLVDECRELNRIQLRAMLPGRKQQLGGVLEGICKLSENYNNVYVLDNVRFISTQQGNKMSIVEGKGTYAITLHHSNTKLPFTKTVNSIIEALKIIKDSIYVDMSTVYEDNIVKELEVKQQDEKQIIANELRESEIDTYKRRIEILTEKYKNDPTKLHLLSDLAYKINEVE